ncbi:hypothetical protein JCM17960_16960 [Magnetospira thiophila]
MTGRGEGQGWADGDAIVVFVAHSQIWWLRWLKPGFRHCFVIFRQSGGWLVCDPLSHQTLIRPWPMTSGTDSLAWLHNQGCRVAVTRLRQAPLRMAPFRLYTCVEAVKRVLGLQDRWILTPWQLFRFLIRDD